MKLTKTQTHIMKLTPGMENSNLHSLMRKLDIYTQTGCLKQIIRRGGKLASGMACALALLALTSCSSPKADGEKAAKLALELRDVNLEHSYDSDEVKEAAENYESFTSKCRKKYENDPKATEEFIQAFNDALKTDLQTEPQNP